MYNNSVNGKTNIQHLLFVVAYFTNKITVKLLNERRLF